MDSLGLFERYRWLVRDSIKSQFFEENKELYLRYLRLRYSEFSVSESVAESMILFYMTYTYSLILNIINFENS